MKEEELLKAYNDFADDIFRFALFKLNDREKAKDALQETFMKTWIYSADKEIGNVRALLYRIASNVVIDEYRRKGRASEKTQSLDDLSDTGFEPGFDETESLFDKIDGKLAMEMIRDLPEIYSEVLFLKYAGNQSISEIAQTLNLTENAISVRINRGMNKLKDIYNKYNNI